MMKTFFSANYDQLINHCTRAYPPGSAPYELVATLPDLDDLDDLKAEIEGLEADIRHTEDENTDLEAIIRKLEDNLYELENAEN